jgi:hypothetical protein
VAAQDEERGEQEAAREDEPADLHGEVSCVLRRNYVRVDVYRMMMMRRLDERDSRLIL